MAKVKDGKVILDFDKNAYQDLLGAQYGDMVNYKFIDPIKFPKNYSVYGTRGLPLKARKNNEHGIKHNGLVITCADHVFARHAIGQRIRLKIIEDLPDKHTWIEIGWLAARFPFIDTCLIALDDNVVFENAVYELPVNFEKFTTIETKTWQNIVYNEKNGDWTHGIITNYNYFQGRFEAFAAGHKGENVMSFGGNSGCLFRLKNGKFVGMVTGGEQTKNYADIIIDCEHILREIKKHVKLFNQGD